MLTKKKSHIALAASISFCIGFLMACAPEKNLQGQSLIYRELGLPLVPTQKLLIFTKKRNMWCLAGQFLTKAIITLMLCAIMSRVSK